MILLDTNILLRYARIGAPTFATVDTSVNRLHANGEVLCVVPQNIYSMTSELVVGSLLTLN